MKAIRKMVNGNKGFMSFMLIFFFLSAGLARNVVFTLPSVHKTVTAKTNVAESDSKSAITPIDTDEDSGINFIDQLKDSDVDDVEIAFYGAYPSKVFTAHSSRHEVSGFVSYHSKYSLPLYDLFCNWKFHLS